MVRLKENLVIWDVLQLYAFAQVFHASIGPEPNYSWCKA